MRKSNLLTPYSTTSIFAIELPQAVAYTHIANKPLNRDHITELNNSKPKQPFFFLKPTSSILPPNSGAVIRPKGVDLHYEVELALIMGKRVKDLEPENEKEALDSVESASCG
jgi:2-keto-4-pentenoate hydratase/2-oxohepta-3-ene-1,7-dioic acid hydratase in catechol pathway